MLIPRPHYRPPRCSYQLTLVDTLDTLVLLNNLTEFYRGVHLVTTTVSFDTDVVVSTFEVCAVVLCCTATVAMPSF